MKNSAKNGGRTKILDPPQVEQENEKIKKLKQKWWSMEHTCVKNLNRKNNKNKKIFTKKLFEKQKKNCLLAKNKKCK